MNDGFAVIKQVLQHVPFGEIFQGENAHYTPFLVHFKLVTDITQIRLWVDILPLE